MFRFGQRLTNCVADAYKILTDWNKYLHSLHVDAQRTSNQVQNLGVKVLSELRSGSPRDPFFIPINVELRNLLQRVFPYKIEFDNFTQEVYDRQLETIVTLVECDNRVNEEFAREMELDLLRARRCAALNEDPE